MTPAEQLAQAMVTFLSFFSPVFIVILVVDWVVGLFRADH